MAYTFHDFIQEKDRPPMKQLTNCQNFESIHLDSVSVQEFPFDDFIQKNELVLSIHWRNDRLRFESLIVLLGDGNR